MTRPTRALLLTCASTFVAMVAYSAPLGNAATLSRVLPATEAATTWILASMSLALALSLLAAGSLADLTGRRRVFLGGALVLAAGGLLGAAAPGAWTFFAGRILQGLGSAGLIATGLGLVVAVADERRRQTAPAWWGASLGLGIAAGPVLSGLLDLAGSWRLLYAGLAVAGVVMAVAAPACFDETPPLRSRRLDLPGAALLAVATGSLLAALVEVRRGQTGVAVAALVVAVVVAPAFVGSQRRRRDPLLEPTLFGRRDFVTATVAAGGTGAGVIALMSFTCTFLVAALGLSTLQAGLLLALWSATSAVSAAATRPLASRIGGSTQLVLGLAGTGAGLLTMTGLDPQSSPARLVPGLLVAGVASGVLNSGLARQATATVPPHLAAVGVGVNNTVRYLGASLGITLVTVAAAVPGTDVAAQLRGWDAVTVLTGAVSLVAAGAVLALTASRRDRAPRRRAPAGAR